MILFCKSGCADVTEIFPYFGAWGQGKSNEDKFGLTLTIALKFWKEKKQHPPNCVSWNPLTALA